MGTVTNRMLEGEHLRWADLPLLQRLGIVVHIPHLARDGHTLLVVCAHQCELAQRCPRLASGLRFAEALLVGTTKCIPCGLFLPCSGRRRRVGGQPRGNQPCRHT